RLQPGGVGQLLQQRHGLVGQRASGKVEQEVVEGEREPGEAVRIGREGRAQVEAAPRAPMRMKRGERGVESHPVHSSLRPWRFWRGDYQARRDWEPRRSPQAAGARRPDRWPKAGPISGTNWYDQFISLAQIVGPVLNGLGQPVREPSRARPEER